jgi:uncharacterized protein with ParB-like and HNH nuclease domain
MIGRRRILKQLTTKQKPNKQPKMQTQKYAVNQLLIETTWVKSGEIAIPEIQRPFVWNSIKVRDLMGSLYQGYPIGYII